MLISTKDLLYFNFAGNQIFTLTARLRNTERFDEGLSSAQDLDVWIRLTGFYGVAKRFSLANYSMYLDHESPRISTSKRKVDGMICFYRKHRRLMSLRNKFFYLLTISAWKHDGYLRGFLKLSASLLALDHLGRAYVHGFYLKFNRN